MTVQVLDKLVENCVIINVIELVSAIRNQCIATIRDCTINIGSRSVVNVNVHKAGRCTSCLKLWLWQTSCYI